MHEFNLKYKRCCGKSQFLKFTLLKKIAQGKRVYVAGLKTDTEYIEFFTRQGIDNVESKAMFFVNKEHEREVAGYEFYITPVTDK